MPSGDELSTASRQGKKTTAGRNQTRQSSATMGPGTAFNSTRSALAPAGVFATVTSRKGKPVALIVPIGNSCSQFTMPPEVQEKSRVALSSDPKKWDPKTSTVSPAVTLL